jgi:hypothetical protein
MWNVLEHGPPQEAAGGEVADVLEVQEDGVLEGGIVGGREVPGEVGEEPDGERDWGPGEETCSGQPGELRGEGRRDPEHEERRRPLRQDDVLEQMRRQQVVGESVERRDCGREEQETTGGEGRDPPAFCMPSTDREDIRDGQRKNGEGRLEVRRPGIWVRAGDPRYANSHAGVAQW